LIKTAELDPTRNYILGIHPHGILCFGSFLNFCTDATSFSKVFPGLRSFLLTLEAQFYMPLHRELFLSTGARSANRESIEWLLTKEGTGNALALIVGGAVEALDAVPGKLDVTLNARKGFVKLALKHGADLVPVISFGENDVYDQKQRDEHAFIKKLQREITKLTSFSPPLFHGRGVFQYTFGLLPYRKPITTVVGKPIQVEKVDKPTEEQVTKLHQQYVDNLIDLFNTTKDKYGSEKLELHIK
jgi:hypothetical protein